MKTISSQTYESLPMHHRLAAAIAALGRGDKAEFERLKSSSKDGNYEIGKLSARINDLNVLSFVIRLSLYEEMTKWLLAQTISLENDEEKDTVLQVINESLTEAASIIAGRERLLADFGIAKDDFEAYDGPAVPMMQAFLEKSQGRENEKKTEEYYKLFSDYFRTRYPS